MVTKVMPDGSLALTDLETSALQEMLSAGDRGAFHYSYYRMSGTVDALLTAKIATFSETVGGTAYASNWYLAEQFGQGGFSTDPTASDYGGIYYLSQLVAQTILDNAVLDVNGFGDGFLADEAHFQSATQAWATAGNPEQFPGLFLDAANPFFDGGTGASIFSVLNQFNPSPGVTASRFGIYYADATGKRLSDFEGVAGFTTIPNGDSSIVVDALGRVVGVFNNLTTNNDALAVAANIASQAVNAFTITDEVREQLMSGLISGDLTSRVEKDNDSAEIIAARRGFSEFSGTYDGDPDPRFEFSYTAPTLTFRAAATAGDDILTTPALGGSVNAGGGDDLVFGDEGIDIMGVQIDGVDIIDGGAGNDIIWGFAGADILTGGTGNDVVRGGAGNDEINGTSGANILDGGSGNDKIFGGTGVDTVIGGAGTDEFFDSDTAMDILLSGIEKIVQGEGSDGSGDVGGLLDGLFGGGGLFRSAQFAAAPASASATENEPRGNANLSNAIANGQAEIGVDIYNTFSLDVGIDGSVEFGIDNFNWGDFSFYLEAGREDIARVGSEEDDRLHGTRDADLIVGAEGDDLIKGRRGDDELSGEQGDDRLFGNSGDDDLYGDRGEDYVNGGWGDDRLWGGADNDRLVGGWGDDQLSGGFGDDKLWGGTNNDLLIGGGGADRLDGGWGRDTADYSGSDEAVSIDLEGGSSGRWWWHRSHGTGEGGEAEGDTLYNIEDIIGSAGADTLLGNRSGNALTGGAGNDVLDGRKGDDKLAGGTGEDMLKGGGGRDTFIFETGDGADTIVDFDTGHHHGWGWYGWGHRRDGDKLSVNVDGFDTATDVLAAASQSDDDVVFDFGDGDTLTLLDTDLSRIGENDLLFA